MSINSDIVYNNEIDSSSPRCEQPKNILKTLKPHQLACLYKAVHMENIGSIKYNIKKYSNEPEEIKISTNIGVLGDIVGYG